jgi:hypothetical protein
MPELKYDNHTDPFFALLNGGYIAKLSGKSISVVFSKSIPNKINKIQGREIRIWGFSTASADIRRLGLDDE